MLKDQLQNRGISNPSVLRAFGRVPREKFVDPTLAGLAYSDRPLPIGFDQTISQPYMVALMSELIDPSAEKIVLEVGTGSGYQAAILAEMVKHVYSIEIVEPLAAQAEQRLKTLGYKNITVRRGDGYAGWPEQSPFDAIVVTAAPDHVPAPLIEQLKPGGKMVIPVGPASELQHLLLLEKDVDGLMREKKVVPVHFVPFTREQDQP